MAPLGSLRPLPLSGPRCRNRLLRLRNNNTINGVSGALAGINQNAFYGRTDPLCYNKVNMEGKWKGERALDAHRGSTGNGSISTGPGKPCHGKRTLMALESLKSPENRLEIIDHPIPFRDGVISLIGVKDCDPERNLGDYQNVAYFLIRELGEGIHAVVIDPGLREGEMIREALGITRCDVIFTHFHLDHWIGYEPYRGDRFYASPLCKTVLTQMVGVERTGKSVFVEGRLNDYHRRPLPLRAANDAERLLPFRGKINEVTGERPYRNELFALEFFELPYGQTEGTLYGLLNTGKVRVLFAGDLFVSVNGLLKVEPHYAFKPKRMVIEDITVMLRAILGGDLRIEPDPVDAEHLKMISSPDLIALGHGLLSFGEYRDGIAHLLAELEELIRIDTEHII